MVQATQILDDLVDIQAYISYKTCEDERYTGGLVYGAVIETGGFKGALTGMRNPKNSWRLADSRFFQNTMLSLGQNDLRLAQNLIKAGTEHCKFLRQINVTLDLNLPRYIWSELDTYHYNTKNSTSTMHKLINADEDKDWTSTLLDELLSTRGKITMDNFFFAVEDVDIMTSIIDELNKIREQFLQAKSSAEQKHLRRRAKQLLPESYLQMRTMTTNYAELRNIYLQRRRHSLDVEWSLICSLIESLPFAQELILCGIVE